MRLEDPIWMNGLRFFVMLLAAILIGLLWRWAVTERRRWYLGVGLGITLLTGEQMIDHYLRLGTPLTWRVPVNMAAFLLLIVSFVALQKEGVKRARTGTERRVHT